MINWHLTRRGFLRAAGTLGVANVVGCTALPIGQGLGGNGVPAFRRTGRGRRISNAAKKHNANRRYATRAAAEADLAHPGDTSRVVQITMNRDLFDRLFANGRLAVDLRRDL
jgi:hypothetical protein